MRKAVLTMMILTAVAGTLLAQMDIAVQEEELQGVIVDNMCADGEKNNLANFIKVHDKACALQKECQASGYSLYLNGKIEKFDEKSNEVIKDFLGREESRLTVEVTVKRKGDRLSLIDIANVDTAV